jgi:hypothetical protein
MMVPSYHHHFEYVMLRHQLAGDAFPDKFQKYFSALEGGIRTEIFRYLQLKYNFVFNVIEDLYKPKGALRLKIILGLRSGKENRLYRLLIRSIFQFMWKLRILVFTKGVTLHPIYAGSPKGKSEKESVKKAN